MLRTRATDPHWAGPSRERHVDTDGRPGLAVVVPVKDEEDNIDSLLAEIHTALVGEDFEVVYVDDGSRDATPARLAAARARYPRLRVITHRSPSGQSAALWSGIEAARARLIATLDGDGQNDPADIPKLLATARDVSPNGDRFLVAGIRVKRRDSWAKRFQSRIANGVRARLLGDATPDTGCGLKLFPRAMYLSLPRFNHMHRFLPALARRERAPIALCPVNHRPRQAGRSKYGMMNRLWVGLVDLFGVMWLQRRAFRSEIVPPS
jgi:dolichol-phosphate mannosyltransferase